MSFPSYVIFEFSVNLLNKLAIYISDINSTKARFLQTPTFFCSREQSKLEHYMDLLTSTPEPKIPPKYQTSSEICSLEFTTFPPGKNSKILARVHSTARGMRVIPRHFAHPPQHIFPKQYYKLR